MRVTMIGHSTVLIETSEMQLLTDPYFGTWGNPAFARLAPPAKQREELVNVDLVLVSHNHWDHTDRTFFHLLAARAAVVAPSERAWLTRLKGAGRVVGLARWETKEFGAVRVTAVPAAHIALTRGYVIESEKKTLYFAGDTYCGPFMREIGRRFAIDAALLPVTTFRIPMTMGEKSAVRAVGDLAPKLVVPIHLGIQPRSSLLRTRDTPEGFARQVREAGLTAEVRILREGESWEG
jgi:L-ascorbate metabolism protein UlaG (beta-lactamase superfamily)